MMSATKTLKSFALSAAVAGAAAGSVMMSAAPASALTFSVNAEVFNNSNNSKIGDITGSFDYEDGIGYSNINLFSSWTQRTYTALDKTIASTGLQAYFVDPASTFAGTQLKLSFARDLGTVGLGDVAKILNGGTLASLEGKTVEVVGMGQFNLYAPTSGDVTAIPTPALLPGLIGMGVAALRKRQDGSEDSAEA